MKRETISQALDNLSARHISETEFFSPPVMQQASERKENMKRHTRGGTRRFVSVLIAACLVLSLGVVAYAVSGIHEARQQELRQELNIAGGNTESYVEFNVGDKQQSNLVLLSTLNDGQEQRVYVNISPVTEAEAASFPENVVYGWNIEGTELWGHAGPVLPSELSVSGTEQIREAVLEHAYDRETQTMTLLCYVNVDAAKKVSEELGSSELPLVLNMKIGDEIKSYGPVPMALTEEQRRDFDFGPARYYDEQLDKEIEIVGLELTPFSAVWKVAYDDAADFHKPEADWDAYKPWSILEEKVCIESEIIFSDGSSFSTGGALTTPYSDGVVNLSCAWGQAIDINAVERIVLGDLVLWENK